MNMAADSHQLLQFAIENDDTDLIQLILHHQAKLCAVIRQLSTPKYTHYMSITCVKPDIKRICKSHSTALRHVHLSSVGPTYFNDKSGVFLSVFCFPVSTLVSA